MIKLIEPYAPRPIRSLGQWTVAGLRLKVHGIGYQLSQPRAEVITAARDLVERELPGLIAGQNHYGVGFVGVHDGRGSIFVFIDFWTDENELRHHVYVAPKDQPTQLEYVTPGGLIACVWDLAVISFVRQAWLDCVLANPGGPDVELYLTRQINEDV
jgi:hypothetical protein